jgi:hypothetical protein
MTGDDYRNRIEAKVAEIDRELSSRWGRLNFKGILSRDMETLEQLHTKVRITYRLSFVIAQIFSIPLIIASLLKLFKVDIPIDLNHLAILIIFSCTFLTNAYRTYKLMVNLDMKIFLLNLTK